MIPVTDLPQSRLELVPAYQLHSLLNKFLSESLSPVSTPPRSVNQQQRPPENLFTSTVAELVTVNLTRERPPWHGLHESGLMGKNRRLRTLNGRKRRVDLSHVKSATITRRRRSPHIDVTAHEVHRSGHGKCSCCERRISSNQWSRAIGGVGPNEKLLWDIVTMKLGHTGKTDTCSTIEESQEPSSVASTSQSSLDSSLTVNSQTSLSISFSSTQSISLLSNHAKIDIPTVSKSERRCFICFFELLVPSTTNTGLGLESPQKMKTT
ncbi:hypothetical protein Fcan01_27253 [Folsomia candida]|uniref:Uncharacterized protein n=1 Tax=Folsomia candida TaxID=158441 RepID=A0A226CZN8_FOLCA|nr:hypothetical protein Fcan01_27253 [Folsomia candida]